MRLPISEKLQYDFTVMGDETVKQFEDKVKTTCQNSGLKNFKVIPSDQQK
jgi:hypothetical protein